VCLLGYAIQHGCLHGRCWDGIFIPIEMYHKVYLVAVGCSVVAAEMLVILKKLMQQLLHLCCGLTGY